MTLRPNVRGLLTDALIWYGLVLAFLVLYVGRYSQPAAAVAPHLLVMSFPFACLALTRVALSRLIGNTFLARALAAVVLTAALCLLLLYYACVLVGLRFWGGVASWDVIPTFLEQGPELADALGLPRAWVLSIAALAAASLLWASWIYLSRWDWTRQLRTTGGALVIGMVAGSAILAAEAYNFTTAPWVAQSEPVSLTLFPRQGARDLEGHAINPQTARVLDRLEDAARAAYVPVAGVARPNLVLIVVDALRADHMGVFGYGRDTTPYLKGLERTLVVRKMIAHASCADTICGLLSLANSKFPRGLSFRGFGLSEVLHRNGYRVHMILSGDHTHFYGMRSYYGGVDTFYDGTDAPGYFINDDQLVLDRLATMPDWDGMPAMFQFHLMSAHILRKKESSPRFAPAQRYIATAPQEFSAASRSSQSAVNFYDSGVARADAVIAQLLQTLTDKGYLRDALVVITADHGESLGEHGLYGHANSVREEVLRIPLLFIAYGHPPATLDPDVAPLQVDIAPTIVADLGLEAPHTWVGHPLQARSSPAPGYFEERQYRGLLEARDRGNVWKYWADGRGEHAFDLTQDPNESHDLISAVPESLRRQWRVRAALGSPAEASSMSATQSDNSRQVWTRSAAVSSSSDSR